MQTSRPAAAPSLQPGWHSYVDAVRFWVPSVAEPLTGKPGQGLRDDRLHLGPRSRARRLRRDLRSLGLRPDMLRPSRYGVSLKVSLGPLWHVPLDLEARARSAQLTPDIHEVCAVAERAGARVTGLELALDLIGFPADKARWMAFPSLDRPGVPETEDIFRLRGNTLRPGTSVQGTGYARQRAADRNLVVYTDRPSKLNPGGPPVLHTEVRLQGRHLPENLRAPRGILRLCQPLTFLRLFAMHVAPGGTYQRPHSMGSPCASISLRHAESYGSSCSRGSNASP